MTLELRVVSGARAGSTERFDTGVVMVGRHPTSDLQFDPHQDLDVSARHAELHLVAGAWRVQDQGSTNGTFVNGERIASARAIVTGDTITFGTHGPSVEVTVAPVRVNSGEVHGGASLPRGQPRYRRHDTHEHRHNADVHRAT